MNELNYATTSYYLIADKNCMTNDTENLYMTQS